MHTVASKIFNFLGQYRKGGTNYALGPEPTIGLIGL